MKVRPPEISTPAHIMIKILSERKGKDFADALDDLLVMYDDKLWGECVDLAQEHAKVDERKQKLVEKGRDNDD